MSELSLNSLKQGKSDINHKHLKADIQDLNLSTVATSGNYNDLTNKPVIPTLSNVYTKNEVDLKIGDIETILNSINGVG